MADAIPVSGEITPHVPNKKTRKLPEPTVTTPGETPAVGVVLADGVTIRVDN
jgi:hypothetical protein